nr:MAG TPA_asm: hypothetical protein [Caudoviricetes sp.]
MRNKWKADNYDNETIPFKFVDLLISNKVALICFVLCIILIPFAIHLNRDE